MLLVVVVASVVAVDGCRCALLLAVDYCRCCCCLVLLLFVGHCWWWRCCAVVVVGGGVVCGYLLGVVDWSLCKVCLLFVV